MLSTEKKESNKIRNSLNSRKEEEGSHFRSVYNFPKIFLSLSPSSHFSLLSDPALLFSMLDLTSWGVFFFLLFFPSLKLKRAQKIAWINLDPKFFPRKKEKRICWEYLFAFFEMFRKLGGWFKSPFVKKCLLLKLFYRNEHCLNFLYYHYMFAQGKHKMRLYTTLQLMGLPTVTLVFIQKYWTIWWPWQIKKRIKRARFEIIAARKSPLKSSGNI